MKKILKNVLPLFALAMLSGCSGETATKTALEAPTNFTFDFEKSAYAFTGSPNATFYSVKVYAKDSEGEIQPHAVASSGMIRATEDNTAYTGTLDYTFLAGDYQAVIKAIAPRYKIGTATYDGKSLMLGAPTVTAYWNDPSSSSGGNQGGPQGGPQGAVLPLEESENTPDTGNENQGQPGGEQAASEVSIDLTITAGDTMTTSYTVSITDTSTNTVVYNNAAMEAGATNLTASDLTGVEKLSTDLSYSVSVQGNALEGYKQASAVTTTVAKKGNNQGGFPGGGGGGGGGGDFTITYTNFEFDEGAETFDFDLSGGSSTQKLLQFTATKAATPNAGCTYSYTMVSKDTGAPFVATWDVHMDFKTDNTALLEVGSAGPISATTKTAKWAASGGKIAVIWDA